MTEQAGLCSRAGVFPPAGGVVRVLYGFVSECADLEVNYIIARLTPPQRSCIIPNESEVVLTTEKTAFGGGIIMGSLALVGSLFRGFASLFTTVSAAKRAERLATLKLILGDVREKPRGVAGWALVFLSLLFLGYDIYATGGQNFDMLLQLVGVALGA